MIATVKRIAPSPPATELDNHGIRTLSPRPQSEEIPARFRTGSSLVVSSKVKSFRKQLQLRSVSDAQNF